MSAFNVCCTLIQLTSDDCPRIFGDDPVSKIGLLKSEHHRPVPNWITVDSAKLDAAIVTDRKRKLPFTKFPFMLQRLLTNLIPPGKRRESSYCSLR